METPTTTGMINRALNEPAPEGMTALATVALAMATDRQAAALERLAKVLEDVKGRAWVEEGFIDCLFVSQPRV